MKNAYEARWMPKLSEGIGLLYDSMLDGDGLQSAMRLWSEVVGATGGAFIQCGPRKELQCAVMHGYDPEANRLWLEHYQFIDPTRSPTLNSSAGEWTWDDTLLSPDRSSEPEYVHDFGLRYGLRYLRGGKMFEDERGSTLLTFHKSQNSHPFNDGLMRFVLSSLQPHLVRHSRLSRELNQFKLNLHFGLSAIENIRVGVGVVNKAGILRYQNRAAEDLIKHRGGLQLRLDRLVGSTVYINGQLLRAMKAAFGLPRQAGAFCAHGEDAQRIHVRIVPLEDRHPLASGSCEPLALVYFSDPGWDSSIPLLQSLFELTRVEGEIADLLSRGMSPEGCARVRGTSLNTVRTQIRTLLAKSDTRSVSELVGLIRCLPSSWPDGN